MMLYDALMAEIFGYLQMRRRIVGGNAVKSAFSFVCLQGPWWTDYLCWLETYLLYIEHPSSVVYDRCVL